MHIKAFKYLSPISIYGLSFIAFFSTGWLVWSPLIYAWVIIPLIELMIHPDERNMTTAEEELAKNDNMYDYLLYAFVLMQYIAIACFLEVIKSTNWGYWDLAGKIGSMGMLCGTFGINIGHELGHRSKPFERVLAKVSLLSSLYMHFFIEHNKGHHKHVATPEDPSSARKNEPVYLFYFRTILFSYLSAWKIANDEVKKTSNHVLSVKNEMLQAHIIQALFILLILFLFGIKATLCYLCAAAIGIILLETVNYIEHYGLVRKQTGQGKYERAMPYHSWNSNHVLGRVMLFELSRHSDHHYIASRKYQLLRHHTDAPQLPTGYPGSMILALIPPVWFYIMNKRIRSVELKDISQ